jgi:hypothetical protein
MAASRRTDWTQLSDAQLLGQCCVDTYRASGPGGQKRNKTSSAVRLRHEPSGLLVIAEESRSQHENRARALRRLREALFLRLREEVQPQEASETLAPLRDAEGRVHLGRKDPRFWQIAGLVLDIVFATQGRVAEAATLLELSTGNLIDLLKTHEKVWEQANQLRGRFGHKMLR